MSPFESDRRRLLRALMALPVGLAAGCSGGSRALTLSPEASLRSLVLLLGPWPDTAGGVGERFAARFLAAPHLSGKLLSDPSGVLQRLASRFEPEPEGEAAAVDRVELEPLAKDERALLLTLARQLYSLNAIQCLASRQPPFGECQEDGTWHTRLPGSR